MCRAHSYRRRADEFAAACPTGLQHLVAALAAEPSRRAATDALCTLLSGGHARAAAADAAPLTAVITQLLALTARGAGAGAGRAARAHDAALLTAVAHVTAAAVEGEPALTATAPLAALLQALVEHLPQRGPTYAAAVLEVLFAANLEAVGDRAEALRGPVYVAAVERVLPEAMFPEDFQPGHDAGVPDGEEEMEEEEFKRFRKAEVADLLAQTCSLCGFGCASPSVCACAWQPPSHLKRLHELCCGCSGSVRVLLLGAPHACVVLAEGAWTAVAGV